MLGAHKRSGVFDSGGEIAPAFGHLGADRDITLNRRAFWSRLFHMVEHDVVAHSDNSLDVGSVAAIYNVLFGEKVGCRNHRSTEFVECGDSKPELVAAL